MASRKDLKKAIKCLFGELLTMCIQLKSQDKDQEKVDQVITEILSAHNDFIARVSHTEPGNVKGFYNALCKSLLDKVGEISGKLSDI